MMIANTMLAKRCFDILHLNINSLVPKQDKKFFITKQSKALITGISEFKLHSHILKSELNIVGYDVIRMNHCREEAGLHKSSFCAHIENTLIRMSSSY